MHASKDIIFAKVFLVTTLESIVLTFSTFSGLSILKVFFLTLNRLVSSGGLVTCISYLIARC